MITPLSHPRLLYLVLAAFVCVTFAAASSDGLLSVVLWTLTVIIGLGMGAWVLGLQALFQRDRR